MTRDEFDKKYSFAKGFDRNQIKGFTMFVITLVMDMTMSKESEDSKLYEFMEDVKFIFND